MRRDDKGNTQAAIELAHSWDCVTQLCDVTARGDSRKTFGCGSSAADGFPPSLFRSMTIGLGPHVFMHRVVGLTVRELAYKV
jgi:hypothetical protein